MYVGDGHLALALRDDAELADSLDAQPGEVQLGSFRTLIAVGVSTLNESPRYVTCDLFQTISSPSTNLFTCSPTTESSRASVPAPAIVVL
jgi:hypothetical protein